MYGGALPVAKSRKSKRKPVSKAKHLEEAYEQPAMKTKKAKKDKAAEATGSGLSTIQEEVQDLEHVNVLNKRTRSGKEVVPSPAQPSIPRKKRKPTVRKLKLTSEEDEEATDLVTREVKSRKETDAAVKKALQLAKDIEIPAEVLAKQSIIEAAQLGLELTENLQQMIEDEGVLKTAEDAQEEAVCSEAVAS